MNNSENSPQRLQLSNQDEIVQVVALHLSLFPDFLIGQIGQKFVSHLYTKILHSSQGAIFVVKSGNRVNGFLCGYTGSGGIRDFKYYWLAIAGVLGNIFRKQGMAKNILRYFLRQIKSNAGDIHSELFSIGVTGGSQKKGVGSQLVASFEGFLRTGNVIAYKIFTDEKDNTSFRFYEKKGFILKEELNILGEKTRCYIKNL